MPVADLFRALGDPTRLEMVRRLASGSPHTLTTISSGLDITRQGARRHLQVLADAKLVTLEPKGRETGVRLDRETLAEGSAFIARLEKAWDARLEKLRRLVEED